MDPIDRLIVYAFELYGRLARYNPEMDILAEGRRKALIEGDECYRLLIDAGAIPGVEMAAAPEEQPR